MKRLLIIVPFLMLACSLWTPYAAMREPPQPTITPSTTATPPASFTPTPAARLCQVTASEALNLRSGPGLSFRVLAWLKPGDLLTVIQDGGAWLAVTTSSGRAGWVKAEFCR